MVKQQNDFWILNFKKKCSKNKQQRTNEDKQNQYAYEY